MSQINRIDSVLQGYCCTTDTSCTAYVLLCTWALDCRRAAVRWQLAGSGEKGLQALSSRLQGEFGKGFSTDTLKNARKFYLCYQGRVSETVFRKFTREKCEAVCWNSEESVPFRLPWSHYMLLMRIRNPEERRFYEIKAAESSWSLRTLQRQYKSGLYERLRLSRNKDEVLRLAGQGTMRDQPAESARQPDVLEFLGLEEQMNSSETELESAIIDKLQTFLLDLGKEFLFEARQKSFSLGEENFHVDLVFYNRLLRCFVLIDVQLDRLPHQDLGQMQLSVSYYDRYRKLPDENPTIGILLCRENNEAVVQMTLPENCAISASEYSHCLPDRELLQKKYLLSFVKICKYLVISYSYICILTLFTMSNRHDHVIIDMRLQILIKTS